MTILNTGCIVVPKKYVRELLFFLDAAGIDGEEYPEEDESVACVENHRSVRRYRRQLC